MMVVKAIDRELAATIVMYPRIIISNKLNNQLTQVMDTIKFDKG